MPERQLAGFSTPRPSAIPVLGSRPGRAIIAGVAVKLLVSLFRLASGGSASTFVVIVDTVAGFAIAAGAFYFLFQLFVLVKRRLLWRVRRKLILSYIFIGFVPAILIVAFFLLFVLLLFFNFSSYLVQTEVRTVENRVRFLAVGAALEIQRAGGRDVSGILTQKRESVAAQYDGVSLAVIAVDNRCDSQGSSLNAQGSTTSDVRLPTANFRSGPWTHAEPPTMVPAWVGCDGFAGLLPYARANGSEQDARTELVVRGIAFPESRTPGYAVVVDLPVSEQVKLRWQDETGVEVTGVSAVNLGNGGTTTGVTVTGPLTWVTFLDSRDWTSGQPATLLVTTQLSLRQIYQRIAAAQGLIGNRSFAQALLLVLLVVVGGLFFIIEVVAFVVGLALAKSITGSVHELFAGTERVRQGDFTHKIAVKAEDQLGELAGSFNSMTASIEDLLLEAAEKKRLEEELRIAHEIQMSLLPQGPLAMPGMSVAAICVPAREVGGDYYDFLPIDDHRVGLLIADVSGKGTSAALYMAELKGLVLSLSRIHTSPREMLISADRIISEHLDGRSFITMTYAVVDMRARTMTYARAGHTPLIHVPGAGNGSRAARILAPDGLVVGLKLDNGELFERLLREDTIALGAGDLYLFFTDGITEAMNAADDCFGEVRLGELVEAHADLPSEELRERVLREIQAFVGGAPQHDDMTMILLKIDELHVPLGAGAGSARMAELK